MTNDSKLHVFDKPDSPLGSFTKYGRQVYLFSFITFFLLDGNMLQMWIKAASD